MPRRVYAVKRFALVCVLGIAACGLSFASPALARQSEAPERTAERLLVRGLTLARIDDHERAVAVFQEALRLKPNEPAILSALAASQEAVGDLPAAVFNARQAVRGAPDQPYYHHQLAQLLLHQGDREGAVAAYRTLLEQSPQDVQALEELARLQAVSGHPREALASYTRYIERFGDTVSVRHRMLELYVQLSDDDGTRRTLEALTRLQPDDPSPWRLLAQMYLQQQAPDLALTAFQRAYAINPNDFETVLALADLYRQINQPEKADDLLDHALDVETASVDDLLARAEPFFARAEADPEAATAATRLLERALDLASDRVEVLVMLGELRYRTEAFAESASLLERALQQQPRDLQLWIRAADAYRQAYDAPSAARVADEGLFLFPGQPPLLRISAFSLMESGRPGESAARFQEYLAILDEQDEPAPTDRADALAALGLLEARSGDAARGEALFTQALELAPDHAPVLHTVALGLAELGLRLGEARRMAERAVALDPENPACLDTLGWILLQQDDLENARQWIGRAVASEPVTATAYEHYGDVHARLGEWEAARRYWRLALDRAPGRASLLEKLEQQPK